MQLLKINFGICALLVCSLGLLSCQQSTSIQGKISGAPPKSMVYLVDPEGLNGVATSYAGVIVDSALIEEDGSFRMTGHILLEEPHLLQLSVRKNGSAPLYFETDNPTEGNFMPVILKSSQVLEVTANWGNFLESFVIYNPDSQNQAMLALKKRQLQAYQKFLANKEWDIENGSGLLERADADLNYQRELIAFAQNTPYILPALVALRLVSPSGDYERLPEFLISQCERWNSLEPDHSWTHQLCQLAQPASLPVLLGDSLPDLAFPTLRGDTISIQGELGSRITLFDLWASWCRPCRIENRSVLAPLWEKYGTQGLQIVAFGLENDANAWKNAIQKDGAAGWIQGTDFLGDDSPILSQLRIQTIPANFILDERGIVVAKNLHGSELTSWVDSVMVR